jgi:hypothetical protein
MGLGRVELPTSRLSGSFVRTRIRLRSSKQPAFPNILLSFSRIDEHSARLREHFARLNGHHNGHHCDLPPAPCLVDDPAPGWLAGGQSPVRCASNSLLKGEPSHIGAISVHHVQLRTPRLGRTRFCLHSGERVGTRRQCAGEESLRASRDCPSSCGSSGVSYRATSIPCR